MKILFTCVGRRVELVQAFKNAALEMQENLKIIGTDIAHTAPALMFCDDFKITCRISEQDYIEQLLNICKSEKIDCLIPTIDTDLLKLAENKAEFEKIGTKVLVSNKEKIKICRDKNNTFKYFDSLGLKTPKAFNCAEKYNLGYPAFIKPKDGSSSINAYKINSFKELKVYSESIEDYIIQPFISGEEYTVDIFCDYDGNPVFVTPRKRLAVRAGEVLKTEICYDEKIISEMLTLIDDFKPCGQITVQLIKEKSTGDNYYIEINPRFGGGAPLSIKSGADSAKAVIEMLEGKKLCYNPKAARNGEIYSRYDQSVCVSNEANG